MIVTRTNTINKTIKNLYLQYLTLSLHAITVLPLTTVYIVSEVHCKGNSHITMITVQSSTIVLLRSTVDYHLIKV